MLNLDWTAVTELSSLLYLRENGQIYTQVDIHIHCANSDTQVHWSCDVVIFTFVKHDRIMTESQPRVLYTHVHVYILEERKFNTGAPAGVSFIPIPKLNTRACTCIYSYMNVFIFGSFVHVHHNKMNELPSA